MTELNNAVLTELETETDRQIGRLHDDDSKNTGFVQVRADIMRELLCNAAAGLEYDELEAREEKVVLELDQVYDKIESDALQDVIQGVFNTCASDQLDDLDDGQKIAEAVRKYVKD